MHSLEVDPGPFEIRTRDGGSAQRVGYAWYEGTGGSQQSYFVLKEGTDFPLSYGQTVIFEPKSMPGVDGPEQFYNWVSENGDLGENPSAWHAQETYEPWEQS